MRQNYVEMLSEDFVQEVMHKSVPAMSKSATLGVRERLISLVKYNRGESIKTL